MGLPRAAASDPGLDPAAVSAFLDDVHRFEMHGLMVVKSGRVVAEAEWAPYPARRPALMYSLSKGFTSAAVGIAVGEGLLSLDDRVLDHLPEYADRTVPELQDLRVRHVLTMSSGHDRDLLAGPRDLGIDIVDLLLTTVPAHAPGTWFQYNQPTTFTAAAIVQRRSGMRLLDYLRPRLFDLLGAAEPLTWIADTRGRDLGFSGLRTDLETIAGLGQLLLDDGVWQGRRILPEGWVADASRPHIDSPREPQPDWRLGYGFQTWMGVHGYRHDGAYGQFCLVFPDADAVVAITSCTVGMQGLLDAVYDHLLPALTDEGFPGGAGAAAARLTGLEIDLPALAGPDAPVDVALTGPAWGPDRLVLDGERLTLHYPDGTAGATASAELTCRADRWSDGALPTSAGPLAVYVRGGLTPSGALHVSLCVTDAPHRLVLESADGSTGTVTWNQAPLHGLDPATLVAV